MYVYYTQKRLAGKNLSPMYTRNNEIQTICARTTIILQFQINILSIPAACWRAHIQGVPYKKSISFLGGRRQQIYYGSEKNERCDIARYLRTGAMCEPQIKNCIFLYMFRKPFYCVHCTEINLLIYSWRKGIFLSISILFFCIFTQCTENKLYKKMEL